MDCDIPPPASQFTISNPNNLTHPLHFQDAQPRPNDQHNRSPQYPANLHHSIKLQPEQHLQDSLKQEQPQLKFELQQPKFQQQQQLKSQQQQPKRKQKMRQLWTSQKYERLLYEFSSLQLGTQSKSLSRIAKEMGFCSRTIQIKWNEYQSDRNLSSIANTLNIITTRNKPVATNVVYFKLIHQILAQNGLLTTSQITKVVNLHLKANKGKFHIHQLSADAVARILQKANYVHLNMAFTIPKNISKNLSDRKDIIERRVQYCQLYKSFLASGAELIFLDQTQISLYLKRKFCWVQKDKPQPVVPKSKLSNISILCIITRNGAAGWRLFQEPLSKEASTSIIKEILKKVMEKTSKTRKKILIVQNESTDNLEVLNLASAVQDAFEVFYFPPYSQVLNPIQCFFRDLKEKIKSRKWSNKKELLDVTKEILEGYKTFNFKPYFKSYVEGDIHKIKNQIIYSLQNSTFNLFKDFDREKAKEKMLNILIECQGESRPRETLWAGIKVFQRFSKKMTRKLGKKQRILQVAENVHKIQQERVESSWVVNNESSVQNSKVISQPERFKKLKGEKEGKGKYRCRVSQFVFEQARKKPNLSKEQQQTLDEFWKNVNETLILADSQEEEISKKLQQFVEHLKNSLRNLKQLLTFSRHGGSNDEQ